MCQYASVCVFVDKIFKKKKNIVINMILCKLILCKCMFYLCFKCFLNLNINNV